MTSLQRTVRTVKDLLYFSRSERTAQHSLKHLMTLERRGSCAKRLQSYLQPTKTRVIITRTQKALFSFIVSAGAGCSLNRLHAGYYSPLFGPHASHILFLVFVATYEKTRRMNISGHELHWNL